MCKGGANGSLRGGKGVSSWGDQSLAPLGTSVHASIALGGATYG